MREPIKRTTEQSRQGSRTRLNLRVLVFSLAVAVIVLSAIYLLFFPQQT